MHIDINVHRQIYVYLGKQSFSRDIIISKSLQIVSMEAYLRKIAPL